MAILNWSKEYSVGVQSIDHEHQTIFAMLNELHDAMDDGEGSQSTPAFLERFVTYTRDHFASEETMMLWTGYPDFARHKVEHDTLTTELAKIMEDINQRHAAVGIGLLVSLCQWFQWHILAFDKQYIGHVRTAGACEPQAFPGNIGAMLLAKNRPESERSGLSL